MFPSHLVDLNPKDSAYAGNFFSVNDGRRCTLGKAVPKGELKHIGHMLLNRTIDDTGHGYVEWDSDRDYFTVEDGAGRKYESRDFAFAANFLFSGQEMLSAGKHAASRMKRLAGKSLRHLYKDDENAGYRNGHPTLGGSRKGSAGFNRKYVALGIAALAVVGIGAYMLGGSQQGGPAPENGYPAYNSSEPIPLSLAIRDYKTITALDPVKDLGAGKYRIGDTIIDTTDDKPDIALAYGGVRLRTSEEWASQKCDGNRCVLSGSVKRTSLRYNGYIYVDKKGIDSGELQERVNILNTPTGYSRWYAVRITADPKGYLNYSMVGEEIKPGLFAIPTSIDVRGNVTVEQMAIGHLKTADEKDLPEKYAELIIPSGDVMNYFKCDSNGRNCQK